LTVVGPLPRCSPVGCLDGSPLFHLLLSFLSALPFLQRNEKKQN
jgi:hypothetical protein